MADNTTQIKVAKNSIEYLLLNCKSNFMLLNKIIDATATAISLLTIT